MVLDTARREEQFRQALARYGVDAGRAFEILRIMPTTATGSVSR